MKRLIYSVFILMLIAGCAQQSALSGGEEDVSPPNYSIETTFPEYGATNFISNKIEIGFDEFINLKSSGKDVVVTPFLKNQPTYEVRGKKIIIKFPEELDENTTYTLNFGNSISDITEGNKIANFSYVFSTGDVLDSLKLSGEVYNAFTKMPVEGAIVGLYNSLSDSIAIHEKPYYFTRTDARGRFNLQNIKEGKYQLIALNDKNNNLKYDCYTDEIAFLDSSVNIVYDTLKTTTILNVYKEEQSKTWIETKRYKNPGEVHIVLNKTIDSMFVKLLNNSFTDGATEQTFFNEDSVGFWLNEIENKENLAFTTNIAPKDTILLKLKEGETDSILKFKTNIGSGLPYYEPIKLTFKTPIEFINKSLILLMDEDSSIVPFEFNQSFNEVLFNAQLKEDINYEMIAYPNAFKGVYGGINDTVRLFFNIVPPNKYGQLILNYEHKKETQHIIQLLKNDEVLEEVLIQKEKEKVVFEHLSPGAYKLKAVVDENKNAKWDPGSYSEKDFPEPVFLFEDKIELKAGWDLDLTWKN